MSLSSKAVKLREWRHRTGRSQRRLPKGPFDAKAIARTILRQYFKHFHVYYREDAEQELALFCAFVEKKNSQPQRTARKKRMGITAFSRGLQRHLYDAAARYDLYRSGKDYRARSAAVEVWFLEKHHDSGGCIEFSDAKAVVAELIRLAGPEMVEAAAMGSETAIEYLRKVVYGGSNEQKTS